MVLVASRCHPALLKAKHTRKAKGKLNLLKKKKRGSKRTRGRTKNTEKTSKGEEE